MTTESGYTTDGKYIMYKSRFSGKWCVETENDAQAFASKDEALEYIKLFLS